MPEHRSSFWILARGSMAALLLAASVGAAGCQEAEGTYALHIHLPDAEAEALVTQVAIWALGPAGHTCEELVLGRVPRTDLTEYASVVVAYPPGEEVSLPAVPARDLLFYAEGRVGEESVVLRGCTLAAVRAGAEVNVTIALQWVCRPDPQGEQPGNGIDDDCDGFTDEAGVCDPGESRGCQCTNGAPGEQVCAFDGSRWEPCVCESPDGGIDGGDGGPEGDTEPDPDPPVRSEGSPSGTLPAGTSAVEISLRTDEDAFCRFATTAGTAFDEMTDSFSTADGLGHTAIVTGLIDGTDYVYHVRCRDTSGNTNPDDFEIHFSIGESFTVHIFRSVGAGNDLPLATGASNPMSLAGGTATFALDLPDRVGVGDILQYDTDADDQVDVLAMITSRINARTYTVREVHGGAAAEPATTVTAWAVFRAYTSLDHAIRMEENPGLADHLENFEIDEQSDLVLENLVWHVACYADYLDMGNVDLRYWDTGPENYLHVFAPALPSEVGTSQRHRGVWSQNGYTIRNGQPDDVVISVQVKYAKFEGLQFDVPMIGDQYTVGISVEFLQGTAEVDLSDCIFRGYGTGVGYEYLAVEMWDTPVTARFNVWNNIIYGFDGAAGEQMGIWQESGEVIAFNNTIVGCEMGLKSEGSALLARNNLIAGCSQGGAGFFLQGTDYNATDLPSMGYTVADGPPLHDRTDQAFVFENAAGNDYHLSSLDLGARDAGSDQVGGLFDTDIDGQARSAPWDIGADEFLP